MYKKIIFFVIIGTFFFNLNLLYAFDPLADDVSEQEWDSDTTTKPSNAVTIQKYVYPPYHGPKKGLL